MHLLKPHELNPATWIQAHADMGKAKSRFDLSPPDGHKFDIESFERFAERDVLGAVDNQGNYIGHVDVWEIGSDRLRLGYRILNQHWGKGLAPEMLATALRRLFLSYCSVSWIDLLIEPDNSRSISVAEKLGFHCTGITDGNFIRWEIERDLWGKIDWLNGCRPLDERLIWIEELNWAWRTNQSPSPRYLRQLSRKLSEPIAAAGDQIVWTGKAPDLALDDIQSLRDESGRSEVVADRGFQRFRRIGRHAKRMLESETWKSKMPSITGSSIASKLVVSYIEYEFGSFCPLHLDRPDAVDWHFLMVVDHRGERSSKLRLYLPEGEMDWQGEPGDMIVFPGSAIPHRRTPLVQGEEITMLAVGFKVARHTTARTRAQCAQFHAFPCSTPAPVGVEQDLHPGDADA